MNLDQKISQLDQQGFCVLPNHLPESLLEESRHAFWPILSTHLREYADQPNRGPNRYFLPMPFELPCYRPEFFFDADILSIVRQSMDGRVVADQWGCDVPVEGSDFQEFHADYQRPLFAEAPDLPLPAYLLVVSFGLTPITVANGPTEIVPGTHKMPRQQALQAISAGQLSPQSVSLAVGDVLIRHPWALHRGTPNLTPNPRPLLTIRYVRRWYADESREVNAIPNTLWQSMTSEQQSLMRFPVN